MAGGPGVIGVERNFEKVAQAGHCTEVVLIFHREVLTRTVSALVRAFGRQVIPRVWIRSSTGEVAYGTWLRT